MTNNIKIVELNNELINDVNKCDGTFTVDRKLTFRVDKGIINYDTESVPSYTKQYGEQYIELENFLGSDTHKIFLAYVDGDLAGQIILRSQWNGYGFIDDIRTDIKYRGMKIGSLLINKAVEWAKTINLKGLSLETQNTNPDACQFYEAKGFKIGGIDTMIYNNFEENANDIAVFWYMHF